MLFYALVFIVMVSVVGSVLAADNSSNSTASTGDSKDIAFSYTCLGNLVGNKTDIGFNDAVFAALALGGKNNLLDTINSNKNSGQACWPKATCTIKDTAWALLALDRAGQDTSSIQTWLKGKTANAVDLQWFIEIDLTSHENGTCTIIYDNSTKANIVIGDNMGVSVSGSGTGCLSSSGNWLKIKDNCIDKTFDVQCNKDFITTLGYQRPGKNTVYISSEVHSAASLGTTEEKVNSKCFKTGSSCDYEGSLWATLALQKSGNDISNYAPYIISLAEDNDRYLPSSFIYLIAGGSEQYSNLIALQKQGKYWEQITGNRLYDTSVGMLGLYGSGANELDSTKDYLMSIRLKNGCWNSNIKDNSFLLYSGWPKTTVTASSSKADCISSGKYCSGSLECSQANGLISYDYSCSGLSVCCSLNPLTQSCSSLNGRVCASGETCDGDSAPSIDGSCCIGTCKVQQQYTCEQSANKYCRAQCNSKETQSADTCQSGVCCAVNNNVAQSSNHTWIWILILGILILLAIIAIVMRDKIRLAWYKYRGKAKTAPVTRSPPGAPIGMRPMPRMMPPSMQRPMSIQRKPSPMPSKPIQKDSEMEETLRKLREMSK